MNISINWLAIIACVFVQVAVGFIWYGPLFGKLWAKLVGITEKEMQKDMVTPMLIMVGLGFVQAFALRHFIVFVSRFYPDYSPLAAGLLTAWWAWLGFAFATMATAYAFARKPRTLILIDTVFTLVVLLLSGAILSVWS